MSLFFDIFSTRGGEWKPTYKKDTRVAAKDMAMHVLNYLNFPSLLDPSSLLRGRDEVDESQVV